MILNVDILDCDNDNLCSCTYILCEFILNTIVPYMCYCGVLCLMSGYDSYDIQFDDDNKFI